jgi:hypothetical protein
MSKSNDKPKKEVKKPKKEKKEKPISDYKSRIKK